MPPRPPSSSSPSSTSWNFDIDRYLIPILPSPPWRFLPYPIAHCLGHRKGGGVLSQQKKVGNIVAGFWGFVGAFCSISLIAVVTQQIPLFREHGAPIIVGSFGAAAVLEFYSIESPLAQPRNAVLSQLIASTVGVGICKLFSLVPPGRFGELRWMGGALSCASTIAIMALTGTVHPPAGATALLAVVDDSTGRLGWFLVPLMMLGCSLMLVCALLVNNVQRRFPLYWWTAEELGGGAEELVVVECGGSLGSSRGSSSHVEDVGEKAREYGV